MPCEWRVAPLVAQTRQCRGMGVEDQAGAGCGQSGGARQGGSAGAGAALGRVGGGGNSSGGSWEKGGEALLPARQGGQGDKFLFWSYVALCVSSMSLWGCPTDGRRARGQGRAELAGRRAKAIP